MAITTYRRRRSWGRELWHFTERCRDWPTNDYEETRAEPWSNLCPECKRLIKSRGSSWPF